MKRLEVYDIECLKCLFLYQGLDINTGEESEFELSHYRNDLYALCKHLIDSDIDYAISFNGLSYDAQVLQYILDNYHKWVDLDNKQILSLIYKFSQKCISDSNYDLFPHYREDQLDIKQIDLFRIHHFDNEQRRCSLKWLQFSMDFHNVEDMPVPHYQEYLSEDEIQQLKDYCRNDVLSTAKLYDFTIGNTDHKLYKAQNKIQDRLDIIKEFGFPDRAINWSDVKIGGEINKKVYMRLTGIKNQSQIYDLKKRRVPKRKFTFGDCIPDYISFKTSEMKDFLEKMRSMRVNLSGEKSKQKYLLSFRGTIYTIAQGGIHSNEKNRIIEPKANEICMDADIGSQYPWTIIKRKLFPSHLGEQWLVGYTQTFNKRTGEYKAKLKELQEGTPEYQKYKGLSEFLKLALNGGGFGKLNESTDWQYDPFCAFSCTIGNQFEILMLIEYLELAGIHVVSANTDGIVCLFDKDKLDTYYEVCHKWEKVVGNENYGKLEYTEYKKLVQLSVNGYLAVKTDGKVKKKKEFLTDYELHKNKSRRILALAMEKYFVEGIDPEDFIMNHDNIMDFCIGVKATSNYHYESVERQGEREIHNKMTRYFISTNGQKLLKIKNEDSEADGNEVSECDAGHWKSTVANVINGSTPIKDYNIDYSYYIRKTRERIMSIERGKKAKHTIFNKNQLSMF